MTEIAPVLLTCPSDHTVKKTGQQGHCVFCNHVTGNGTPWPQGGVVCPCCIITGIFWKAEERSPS